MKHWPPHSAMLVLFPNKIGFCSFFDKRDSPDMTWKSMRNEAGLRRSGQWWTDGERQMISRLVLCKYFSDYISTEKSNMTWPGSTTRAIDWQLLEHETGEKSRKHTVFCQTEYIFLLPMSVLDFRRGTVLCGEPIGQSEESIGSDWPMRSRHNGMLDIDKPAEVDNLGLCLSLTMWEYTQETIDLPSIIQTTTKRILKLNITLPASLHYGPKAEITDLKLLWKESYKIISLRFLWCDILPFLKTCDMSQSKTLKIFFLFLSIIFWRRVKFSKYALTDDLCWQWEGGGQTSDEDIVIVIG